MLGTGVIVFREVLEAALVVSIVMAAARGLARRGWWVSAGVAAGLAGAALVAAFAESIANALAGMGQEVFNAGVLFAAVGMLGWHNVWMTRHGREIAQQMTAVGRDVAAGTRPLYVLGVVVGLAVLREGSEIVLFVYGIAASGGRSAEMLGGATVGLAGGVALGVAMYFGLLRVPLRHLFTVTSWLILLLAAGMASHGAAYLVQAGLLPPLANPIWDTSGILSDRSMVGQLLHILVGYDDRPAGMQLVFYLAALFGIGGLMRLLGRVPMGRTAGATA